MKLPSSTLFDVVQPVIPNTWGGVRIGHTGVVFRVQLSVPPTFGRLERSNRKEMPSPIGAYDSPTRPRNLVILIVEEWRYYQARALGRAWMRG